MLKSFRHKGLRDLFESGKGKGLGGDLARRVRERLLVIDAAGTLDELNVPGWGSRGVSISSSTTEHRRPTGRSKE